VISELSLAVALLVACTGYGGSTLVYFGTVTSVPFENSQSVPHYLRKRLERVSVTVSTHYINKLYTKEIMIQNICQELLNYLD
jgi:hypothetical protein